mmetsp:Transcript_38779/g.121546  ORF Transcript_38779/g.121546 Transcript_38779/m.121546 type:complete len:288 (-) Transcript_38779:528-1391(-)
MCTFTCCRPLVSRNPNPNRSLTKTLTRTLTLNPRGVVDHEEEAAAVREPRRAAPGLGPRVHHREVQRRPAAGGLRHPAHRVHGADPRGGGHAGLRAPVPHREHGLVERARGDHHRRHVFGRAQEEERGHDAERLLHQDLRRERGGARQGAARLHGVPRHVQPRVLRLPDQGPAQRQHHAGHAGAHRAHRLWLPLRHRARRLLQHRDGALQAHHRDGGRARRHALAGHGGVHGALRERLPRHAGADRGHRRHGGDRRRGQHLPLLPQHGPRRHRAPPAHAPQPLRAHH